MNIYKELYEYLKSADVEAQNRAFNTPDYVFDLSYEEFCKQIKPLGKYNDQSGKLNNMYGKNHTKESREKMSAHRANRPSGALGKNWKRSEESKLKMSNTCRGRKKYTRPDGSWTWIYPSKTLD